MNLTHVVVSGILLHPELQRERTDGLTLYHMKKDSYFAYQYRRSFDIQSIVHCHIFL